MLTAEGCSALLMLELTKPGVNDDLMTPQALCEVAPEPKPVQLSQRQMQAMRTVMDIPRFLNGTA